MHDDTSYTSSGTSKYGKVERSTGRFTGILITTSNRETRRIHVEDDKNAFYHKQERN